MTSGGRTTTWISVVLSFDERDAINAAAKAAGMSRNAWLRMVLAEAVK